MEENEPKLWMKIKMRFLLHPVRLACWCCKRLVANCIHQVLLRVSSLVLSWTLATDFNTSRQMHFMYFTRIMCHILMMIMLIKRWLCWNRYNICVSVSLCLHFALGNCGSGSVLRENGNFLLNQFVRKFSSAGFIFNPFTRFAANICEQIIVIAVFITSHSNEGGGGWKSSHLVIPLLARQE